MKIELQLNQAQLDVLLSQIESCLAHDMLFSTRGPRLADAATALPPNGSSYDIAQLAPIYRQLVAAWPRVGTPTREVHDPDWQRKWGSRHSLALKAGYRG